MKSPTWHGEQALLLLMSGGFFVHLISVSRRVEDSQAQVGDIVLWPVDLALFVLMAYCSVTLITRFRHFASAYELATTGRKLGYWAITAYVTVSLPGHAVFLLTGDTGFFDGFPWWFSVVILPVYVLVVGYVVTLQRQAVPATQDGVPATELGGAQDASDRRVAARLRSATS
jgi:hypothetical protein